VPNIPAQIIARATGVTGNQIFPDTFDFKQITTEPTTADSRPVGDCEGATYLTGQIFGGVRGGEDWTVIVVTDHGHGLLLPAVRLASITDGTSNTPGALLFHFESDPVAQGGATVPTEALTIAHDGFLLI